MVLNHIYIYTSVSIMYNINHLHSLVGNYGEVAIIKQLPFQVFQRTIVAFLKDNII